MLSNVGIHEHDDHHHRARAEIEWHIEIGARECRADDDASMFRSGLRNADVGFVDRRSRRVSPRWRECVNVVRLSGEQRCVRHTGRARARC